MAIDYEAELNPEQYEAVTNIDGPLLIIAGAGSGKTRVITYRMAYMLDHGVSQHSILALTFTNKAAKEMAERVRELTKKKLRDVTVSTFHAFGVKILRKDIGVLGFRDNFSIYDEVDRTQLIKDCAREMGFRMESFDPWKVGQLFSEIRSETRTWSKADDAYRGLYDEYRRSLRIYNSVDFDDLIVMPIEIFELDEGVRARYRERYKYIMIDEFQDTSLMQYRMMHLMASHNVCAVGDDDQSIYSWRGANYENITRFESDFPEVREIKLERNYRSTATILEAANAIIANNTNRKEKALWSPTGINGTAIELYAPEDEVEEAEFIARSIRTIKGEEHVPWDDFGILIRINSLTRWIEEALLAENVPYRISGGTSFFGRKEIKDITSYLRVLANPDDDVNLIRILNTPRRGIGKTTLERLGNIARARGCTLRTAMELVRKGESVENFVLDAEGREAVGGDGGLAFGGLSAKAVADIEIFIELMETHREEILGKKRIAEKVRKLVDDIDYWAYIIEENKQNDKVAKWKFHNIETYILMIDRWEKDPDNFKPGLFNWLNRISLITRDDGEEDEGGKVNLMTIHAAKGLEFQYVYIAGCEDGIIPHAKALEEGEGNLEEERRLFYVAVTRARKRLYITSALRRRKQNQVSDQRPSPFLEEIPAHLVEHCGNEAPLTDEEGEEFFGKLNSLFSLPEEGAAAVGAPAVGVPAAGDAMDEDEEELD
jgi:DNA helicase-2/ATP-dependent DNA helicase PcrA